MREILFRAVSISKMEWVYGLYGRSEVGDYITDELGESWLIDKTTLGQYTGIRLKGEYLFEGDILILSGDEPYTDNYFTTDYNWEMDMKIVYEVSSFLLQATEDKYMQIYLGDLLNGDIAADKIGNIHDNPELLEVS